MKYLLVIGDGMADDPIPELDGKTALQYAKIPTMDKLASAGVIGTVLTVPEGMPAGSDTAMLSIFGYDPNCFYSGRAPIEAVAAGISLSSGDIAYRCNMITIEDGDIPFEEKKILSHSADAISADESDALIRDLFEMPDFSKAAKSAKIKIYPGSSFRHLAVQSSSGIIDMILTPPHDHLGESLGRHLPKDKAKQDIEVTNEPCNKRIVKRTDNKSCAAILDSLIRLSHDLLDDHPINKKRREEGKLPANCIWFWAEGTAIELPNFEKRYGKSGSVISAVPLCRGIAMLIGLERIIVEGATGELYTNYEGKVNAAIKALKTKDFVTVHIEAPDECTHNGELKGKVQAIKWVDSKVIKVLLEKLEENKTDFRMLVMSDHRTLISTRGHDGGPVPYILYDSRYDSENKLCFNEEDAKHGKHITKGTKLMNILFESL
ncbi:MAG: cofactor-independent phosphoglycerate mutase [Oscillospiraceae bacterium]|jgi:2,3-bisphosphoglycerate-independent phosphoglycerate mutase|nr:cofactor-independent phosphoglycerate mutase [Oscillospiraceae bacterium]